MSERYEILGKLARGGIGAIYRANDTVMGREVAIKRLLPLEETHLNEAADESLEREAAALARFQHPNVVTIFAFESDEDGPFVVMELVEGENLKETIERGALPIDDFKNLVLQTLDPLIAAKDMGLLHRDIKPSNIMLTWLSSGRFQVKVLDFGLAKFSQAPSTQTLDQTGSFLGSIDYLAPEQLELAPLDQRADLYSFGCVLYYCLTQRPPFEGKNSAATIQNHLKHEVTPLREVRADVPPPLADWVMRMISRYPNQRPEDARVAMREFEAALTGVSPSAREPSEPVVEVVEEMPVAELAETSAEEVDNENVNTQAGSSGPVLKVSTASQPVQRPKLNTDPATRVRSGTGPTKRAAPIEKKTAKPSTELRKPLIALVCSVVAAGLVLILLLNDGCNDEKSNAASSGGGKAAKSSSSGTRGAPEKASKAGSQKGATGQTLPVVKNPAAPAKTPPPPVPEGLVAHYKAGERCWGGSEFKTPVKPNQRIKAWGNLASGAAEEHLLTVDADHQEKGPQFRRIGPKARPELNETHPVLTFRNWDRLITQEKSEIGKSLSKTALTVMLVIRTESPGGQIVRLMGAKQPSRILKIEISGQGENYKSIMAKGSLRPWIETKLGEGKGRFLIFTHVWSGDESGVQRHHFLLPDKKRFAGKAGDAPHYKNLRQSPASYALGATDASTAEVVGEDEKGQPRKEGTGGFKGDLAEWLIYNRALSDPERKQVEDYLYQRYFAPK